MSCRSRGQIKGLHHQLAGALDGIAAPAVAPDMGAGLGADLDDVLAKHAAGPADSIGSRVRPAIIVRSRGAPLPVGECRRLPVFTGCLDEITGHRKAGPRHAAVGAREDDLHAARRGMLAATVHDRRNRGYPDGAYALIAGGLRLRRSCRQQEARRRGRREGRQSSKGGGSVS